jgi:(p)ppGpp synthase/HD superfamily hydrolase
MMTIEDLNEAYDFARESHKGQKRRDGSDYFRNHLKRVYIHVYNNFYNLFPKSAYPQWVEKSDNFNCVLAAALLHDVLEDYKHTGVIAADLIQRFPPIVCELVEVLTRDQKIPYFDYIMQINNSHLAVPARAIKLADLHCNLEDTTDRLSCRYTKYKLAQHILLEANK